MPGKRNNFFMNVLQAVVIAAALAVLGDLWKTYMDVHDLKIATQDEKAKLDWLYQYTFPHMGDKHDPGNGQ
jgi:hypothetical protein